jgi:hypothetical protein
MVAQGLERLVWPQFTFRLLESCASARIFFLQSEPSATLGRIRTACRYSPLPQKVVGRTTYERALVETLEVEH